MFIAGGSATIQPNPDGGEGLISLVKAPVSVDIQINHPANAGHVVFFRIAEGLPRPISKPKGAAERDLDHILRDFIPQRVIEPLEFQFE